MMKFAFSTESCPDLLSIARKAREYGYDGVEVSGSAGAARSPTTVALDDPTRNREVHQAFNAAGVEIACIAAPVRMTGDRHADGPNAEALRRWIDLAAELACPRVMIRDPELRRGISGIAAGIVLGDWLAPLADHALTRNVSLLVCNESALTSARLMWTMLERMGHPAVGCCWDIANAAKVGESPSVSVPTLNSQIRYARIGDIAPASETAMSGEPGHASLQLFLTRLRGIGYDGYVTAAMRTASHGEPDEYLRDAINRFRKWGHPALSMAAKGRKQETRPKAG